jgi:uncharacterized protein (TIGR03435 family)
LLVDRFKLKAHTETREIPLYVLVVARNDGKTGAKLTPNASACPDVKVLEQQRYEAMAKGGLSALQAKPGETGTMLDYVAAVDVSARIDRYPCGWSDHAKSIFGVDTGPGTRGRGQDGTDRTL